MNSLILNALLLWEAFTSPVDYRKAEDADEQLLERLQATFDGLARLGKYPKR